MNLGSKNISLKDLSTDELISKIEELISSVDLLQKENSKLRLELAKYQHPKNSRNSSIPPSQDENRPRQTKSLRKKSDKKPGAQKGHKGSNLSMTDSPDEIVELVADYCNVCGEDLKSKKAIFRSKRQVIDIPPVSPIVTEYRNFEKVCNCGHHQQGTFPEHVTNHIQYGVRIIALACYFSVYQYMPFKRMQQMFNQVFNLSLSQGTLVNMIENTAHKALPLYEEIRSYIEQSDVVGADETGIKVNGDKFWGWIWQNMNATFIAITSNRGNKTIEKYFPNGFLNGIIISDRWRPQLDTNAKGHQLCIPHLLRNLTYLIELEKTQWAKNINQLFLKALSLKKNKVEYKKDDLEVVELEKEMDKLLIENLDESKKTNTFKNSMIKNRDAIFLFLYHSKVPPDNNASERGVRNFKVKLKISGQFKSGHQAYAILRSVIDTSIKNSASVFENIMLIAMLKSKRAE